MGDPRAFLSFDFDNDATSKNLFAGQAKSGSPTPFVLEDWSSKSELPQVEWKERIAAKISSCHLMIVLVGKSMSSAHGVAVEIALATSRNIPFFGVYVGGADARSTLPSGLARNRTISWNWQDIGNAIDQMMGEGKNA